MPAVHPPAVEVQDLSKTFAGRVALDGIDLQVDVGVVHGLLGLNGAGKTTLLRVLLGLVRPDGGEVRLRGRGWTDRRRLDGVAGFVGTPAAYPYLSGRRNLELVAALDRLPDAAARVQAVLAEVALGERAGDLVSRYSLGMRQRLAIAAALLRRPRLLILDEPTNGLDPEGARRLRQLLREQADAGNTVLLSSHDMAEMDAVCDAVTVVHAGRVQVTATMPALRRSASSASYRLETSDDLAALDLAGLHPPISASARPEGGLELLASEAHLDTFVVDLGIRGIAVRRLSLAVAPLERVFLDLVAARTSVPAPVGAA